MNLNVFGEKEKPSVVVERTKLEGIDNLIKFRIRNRDDLQKFAALINREDILMLNDKMREMTISWSAKGSSLMEFFE